jgi:Leucine-rich repeat (LRR) protein
VGSARLTSLDFVSQLVALESLDVSDNPVRDLAPLAGLAQLQRLYAYMTQIRDLRPLASLTRLETLAIFDTPVADVRPLLGLPNLAHLEVPDGIPKTQLDALRRAHGDLRISVVPRKR